MSFVEDIFKGGNLTTGLAIGLGTVILGPVIIPMVSSVVKPVAKAAIKGGLSIYEAGKGTVSGATEAIGNLIEEARSEMKNVPGAEEKTPGHPRGTPHEVS